MIGKQPEENSTKSLIIQDNKQLLSQSSGFSTFDTFSLKIGTAQTPEPLRMD